MEIFAQADTWIALVTLTFLEIILGIDNVIFISISANKLPENKVRKATILGLALAMITRILLLFSVSYLIALKEPFLKIDLDWFKVGFTGQSIILFLGGLFLLYKSTKEIHEKVEDTSKEKLVKTPKVITFSSVITQIILIDIVFSFDSILTAVGMTNGVDRDEKAFKTFAYYVKRYIGEYLAVLNGADLIAFTAGAGENSPILRKEIIGNLNNLGIFIYKKV